MVARFGSTRQRPGYLTFRLISQPLALPPAVVVVVVPRKRSRSMRKLPCQELLTINYSSRYPSLPCSGRSPPLLMQMTAGPAGSERSTRHLLTVTRRSLAERAAKAKGKERRREAAIRYRGEARIATNLHFIARVRDRLATPPARHGSLFVSYLPRHPTSFTDTDTRCVVVRVTQGWLSILVASIGVAKEKNDRMKRGRVALRRDSRRCFHCLTFIFSCCKSDRR